jgi:hypothetical protein
VLVGCGSGGSVAPATTQTRHLASVHSPFVQRQDVVSRLSAAGVACSDVQYGVTGAYFGATPEDQATCAIRGYPIFVAGYATPGEAIAAVSAAQGLACAYAQQFSGTGTSYLYVVNDQTRDVAVADRTGMETVARVLGGRPIVVGC